MVRLSDLIKPGQAVPAAGPAPIPRAPSVSVITKAALKQKDLVSAPAGDSQGLYAALTVECERCLQQAQSQQPLTLSRIPALIEQTIAGIQNNDAEWQRLTALNPHFTLATHGVNVAILAIRVGMEWGIKSADLVDTGIAALLHDVGMVKLPHLLQAPYHLGPEDFEAIHEHPVWGSRIAQRSPELPPLARTVIIQEHERADGTGYPNRLSGEAIDKHAQLIGLLDVYEALTHERPYRSRLLAAEASRAITRHQQAFGRDLLRAFLRGIPVFPEESWVRLNSGDVAQVVRNCGKNPFLPTVSIRFDRLNQPYPQPETVDLSRQSRLTLLEATPDPVRG